MPYIYMYVIHVGCTLHLGCIYIYMIHIVYTYIYDAYSLYTSLYMYHIYDTCMMYIHIQSVAFVHLSSTIHKSQIIKRQIYIRFVF